MIWTKCRTRIAIYGGKVRALIARFASLFSAFFSIILFCNTLFLGYYFLYTSFVLTSYTVSFKEWFDEESSMILKNKIDESFKQGVYFWHLSKLCDTLKKEYASIDTIDFFIDQNRVCHCTVVGPEFFCLVNDLFCLSKKGLLYEKKAVLNEEFQKLPHVQIDFVKELGIDCSALVAPLTFFLSYQDWKVRVKSFSEIFLISSDENKKYCFLYDSKVTNSTFLSLPTDIDAQLKAKNISLKKGEQWVFDMRFGSYIVVGKTKKGGRLL